MLANLILNIRNHIDNYMINKLYKMSINSPRFNKMLDKNLIGIHQDNIKPPIKDKNDYNPLTGDCEYNPPITKCCYDKDYNPITGGHCYIH